MKFRGGHLKDFFSSDWRNSNIVNVELDGDGTVISNGGGVKGP